MCLVFENVNESLDKIWPITIISNHPGTHFYKKEINNTYTNLVLVRKDMDVVSEWVIVV